MQNYSSSNFYVIIKLKKIVFVGEVVTNFARKLKHWDNHQPRKEEKEKTEKTLDFTELHIFIGKEKVQRFLRISKVLSFTQAVLLVPQTEGVNTEELVRVLKVG